MVADEPNAKRNKCWLLCSRMDPRVSQKPQKATEDEKNKRKRKKKSKQTITRAVTPIRLIEANPGKLDVLDQLVEAYLEDLADYAQAKAKAEAVGSTLDPKRKEPIWKEWNTPTLRRPSIQANANVVVVEKSEDSTFDYWLRMSTLDKGHPLHIGYL